MSSLLEACAHKCVPYYFKDTEPEKHYECPEVNPRTCYKPRLQDESFYRSIKWDALLRNIEEYMTIFAQQISESREISDLMREVYKYGPYPLSELKDGMPIDYAFFETKIEQNDDSKHCYNILIRFVINRGITVKGRKKQEIAHISLHPRAPKFYRDSSRSRSGCGYYERPEEYLLEEGQESHPSDTGPFHYVIDTFYWGDEGRHIDRPTLEFGIQEERGGAFMPKLESGFSPSVDEFPVVLDLEYPEDLDETLERQKEETRKAYEESLEGLSKVERKKASKVFAKEQQAMVKSERDRLIREYYLQNKANEETIENVRSRRNAYRVKLHRQSLLELHKYLYLSFINFWNTEMINLKVTNRKKTNRLPTVKKYRLKLTLGKKTAASAATGADAGVAGGTRKKKRVSHKTRRSVADKHK